MKTLLIVDVQNDFCPGGALAVPDGDAVVPIINAMLEGNFFDLIIATQDWHPANHFSFASQHAGKSPGDFVENAGTPQILWPDHCVQSTPGADLRADLEIEKITRVFQKGGNRLVDSYSGFYDNNRQISTGLGEYLKSQNVREVYVCGLATDYCVKFSALDAQSLGFQTFLIEDASRGVNLKSSDVENAIREMRDAGVTVIQSAELVSN